MRLCFVVTFKLFLFVLRNIVSYSFKLSCVLRGPVLSICQRVGVFPCVVFVSCVACCFVFCALLLTPAFAFFGLRSASPTPMVGHGQPRLTIVENMSAMADGLQWSIMVEPWSTIVDHLRTFFDLWSTMADHGSTMVDDGWSTIVDAGLTMVDP